MTQELKEQIQKLFLKGSLRILKDYTNSALLINSCHLAIERYSDIQKPVHLSTTANIPGPLRLDVEFEEELHNEALVERYSTDTQKLVFEQYISNCVSVIDGVFEDIYEVLLTEFEMKYLRKELMIGLGLLGLKMHLSIIFWKRQILMTRIILIDK